MYIGYRERVTPSEAAGDDLEGRARMPRNRKPRRRRAKAPRLGASAGPSSSGWRGLQLLWPVIVVGSVILAYIALWPRIVIDPEGDIDPANPTRISFKVTNTGFIPLHSVKAFVGLCTLYAGEPTDLPERCDKMRTRLFLPRWDAKSLRRDEPETIRLDEALKFPQPAKLGAADMSIGVSFTPWVVPIQWELEYRFQTHAESDGKLSWIRRPMEK